MIPSWVGFWRCPRRRTPGQLAPGCLSEFGQVRLSIVSGFDSLLQNSISKRLFNFQAWKKLLKMRCVGLDAKCLAQLWRRKIRLDSQTHQSRQRANALRNSIARVQRNRKARIYGCKWDPGFRPGSSGVMICPILSLAGVATAAIAGAGIAGIAAKYLMYYQ